MNKLNKMLLSVFAVLFLIFNILSINFDSQKLSIFIYDHNILFWIINVLFLFLSCYFFLVLSLGSSYKKLLPLFLKQQTDLSQETQKIGKALFFTLVLSLTMFIISSTGITVFTGHKCRDNKIENCRIDGKTLRSLYLPDFMAAFLKKQEYLSEFNRGNIIYFSARVKSRNYSSLAYLLLLLSPIVILRFKK